MEYAWPLPLTNRVNTRFDEKGPAISPDNFELYFASNRPRQRVDETTETLTPAEIEDLKTDYDIYSADIAGETPYELMVERQLSMLYSLREGALGDERVMAKLGGTRQTEAAVDKALAYLASIQSEDGRWDMSAHGGKTDSDMAGTGAALLAFYGRGQRHDEPCKYQQVVKQGIEWLVEQQDKVTGDLRGIQPRARMYNHGIAALAMVEAYGVTKDLKLRPRAQSAVEFIEAAQHHQGGWRYSPGERGDLSVSGWMIMVLASAQMSGLDVKQETLDGARRFLDHVSSGRHGGAFGYTDPRGGRGHTPAMNAVGFFCRQLLGLSNNSELAWEASSLVDGKGFDVGDLYYSYYGTLASYQHQGPAWRRWMASMQKQFVRTQRGDGAWTARGGHGGQMGTIIATALVTLSLEAHYRYTPLYGLGFEPDPAGPTAAASGLLDVDQIPEAPLFRHAQHVEALSSPANESDPVVTDHGDFLYFASSRDGGYGGSDIYRSRFEHRVVDDEQRLIVGVPQNVGPEINSAANESAPALRLAGFQLLFNTDRGQNPAALYAATSKRVECRYSYLRIPDGAWLADNFLWLLGMGLALTRAGIQHSPRTSWCAARRRHGSSLGEVAVQGLAAMRQDRNQVPPRAWAADSPVAAEAQPWRPWIAPLVALIAVIVFGLILHHKLRNDVWAYYTDGEGIRVAAKEKKERMVLWEDPQQHVFQQQPKPEKPHSAEQLDQASQQRVEAAFSPDGAMMVLTRWKKQTASANDTDADLYLSNWDGRTWSRPEPMVDLNTRSNERGAAFSRDGKYLYFSSDRDGGAGGYDLYVARNDGNKWAAVTSLGNTINSARNESGPAPSAERDQLYFSSDRNSEDGSQDIFVAKLLAVEPRSNDRPESFNRRKGSSREKSAELPPVPTFGEPQLVGDLSSPADDIEAALTSRGSYVFLASDRDRNRRSGFNLYVSRVIDGRIQPPQKVDVYIRKGNATDPAVRMEGFDLLFSADGDLATSTNKITPDDTTPQTAYRLYRSTTREVIGYTDLSRWELFKSLMNKIQWLILLAIAALISLIYLLEKWRNITSLFHKCLAASAGVHLVLLMFMMFWLISQAIDEGSEEPPAEVAISVDALAQEELAMESEQELAEVMDTTQMVVTKSEQEFPETAFEPQQIVDNPVPIVPKQFEQSLVSDFQQSTASESTESAPIPPPVDQSSKLVELSPIELPITAAEAMEVAELPNDNSTKPVDPTRDDFRYDEVAIQQVESQKASVDQAMSSQLDVQADTESVGAAMQ